MGTSSGGSLTNRVSPSTTSVSLSSACMLSRVRALASVLVGSDLDFGQWSFRCFFPVSPSSSPSSLSTFSMSIRAYQTSRSRMVASFAISVR